jgi:hypothetical protein
MGKRVPNLLVIRDSGLPDAEFRVQCEVVLSQEDAKVIESAVIDAGRTAGSIEAARQIVLNRLDPAASEAFRQIINLAFAGQPECEEADARAVGLLTS